MEEQRAGKWVDNKITAPGSAADVVYLYMEGAVKALGFDGLEVGRRQYCRGRA